MTALLFLLLGCAPTEDDPCPNELDYDSFGKSLMSQYCTGCHSSTIPPAQRNGAPEVVNLDTYGGVMRWIDHIEESAAAEPPTMPPGGGTTELERDLLREWISCAVRPDIDALQGAP